jgi:hypothetical protein
MRGDGCDLRAGDGGYPVAVRVSAAAVLQSSDRHLR